MLLPLAALLQSNWCCGSQASTLLLQVVVPQGVLTRASAQLTVTQALEIADMTLETSCRAIQWALNVPEVLLASSGRAHIHHILGQHASTHLQLRVLPECRSCLSSACRANVTRREKLACQRLWQACISLPLKFLPVLCCAGGMLWHGRDLRQYRRLLSPPMELFGTCPGKNEAS